jgi:hypothetical protein
MCKNRLIFRWILLISILGGGITLVDSQVGPARAIGAKVGVIPKEGFVPSAEVALNIAEAVLNPVYGKELIISERPFKATLNGDVWMVIGSVPCDNPPPGAVCPGGSAEVRISKKTGQILYMSHSQ